jgi:murein L,D-transpeptidase YafK
VSAVLDWLVSPGAAPLSDAEFLSYATSDCNSTMSLTLLVGTVAFALAGHPDSVRAVAKTTASPAPASALAFTADSIVVEKSKHQLSLYANGTLVRQYLVALGARPVGDKVRVGDRRTPEGIFRIEARKADSRYHRALRISYPDAAHRARARALGVSPGGDIMIHGLPARQAWVGAAHRDFDWTEGCIAVTNQEIEEIWSAVPVGTLIHIKP